MRILTVRQPWASAIINYGKDVENRVRNIAGDYRGPVAIHAGLKRFDPRHESGARVASITGYRPLMFMPTGYGHIIGVVDLVDVHHWSDCLDGVFGCSLWADSDSHHLVLKNPRAVSEAIPFKGALPLRELDAETTERVLASIVNQEEAL